MYITRLRLLGFKSFVEPTELLIENGLTGVVGPNGCGKSNLLEALRWVMGETSYKNMRASAMDDVIFSGTNTRPQRQYAEVSIFLDNSARSAPPDYNDSDELVITRKIEREAGSAYKINGRDVRARDVQLLFADASTGARSPALVQQGRIGEIVNSKPQARRRILEEAAGITGLHSRRHEAELRLKAAEGNLERLQDIMGQIGSQLSSLKRQARQASKYKDITTAIQKAEAIQCHLAWTAAGEAVAQEEARLQEAMSVTSKLSGEEKLAKETLAKAAELIQPLRDEQAKKSGVLQKLHVSLEALDQEEAQAKTREEELQNQCRALLGDIERECAHSKEAQDLLKGFDSEKAELAEAVEKETETRQVAELEATKAKEALAGVENVFSALTSEVASARAKQQQLSENIGEIDSQIKKIKDQDVEYESKVNALQGELQVGTEIETLTEEINQLGAQLQLKEAEMQKAESQRGGAVEREKAAEEKKMVLALKASQLETEVATLTKLLKPSNGGDWPPIVDQISVEPGFEMALGVALGDDLDVPADNRAPAHWAKLSGAEPKGLPPGVTSLIKYVNGPVELRRRLTLTGIVDRDEGDALHHDLKPGERLVSVEGDLWRWDGFTAAADAPTAAARRLVEKNRLSDLEAQCAEAKSLAEKAEENWRQAKKNAETSVASENALRKTCRDMQERILNARQGLSEAEKRMQSANEQLARLGEARAQFAASLQEIGTRRTALKNELGALPLSDDLETRLKTQTESVEKHRSDYSEAQARLAGLERDARLRQERLVAIAAEEDRSKSRLKSAEAQIASLKERAQKVEGELTSIRDLPAAIGKRREKILTEVQTAKDACDAAAKQFAAAETELRNLDKALGDVQQTLAASREERARVETRLESQRERRSEQARLIRDTLSCAPEECLSLAGLEEGEALPTLADVESKLVKLKADRERLGGVNLRAEEEAAEFTEQFGTMEQEKEDLEQAISKLRSGISNLNREGRKRLLEAFEAVSQHFERLFKVLFGGGEAHLQLIESDDPLEAGLEIVARPPGKKPQVLTLLSGGEKALTALSLIFAVFLTNPSPICVLDEVDAPLDDANVDRFCTMMEEMRQSTDTRFLVITHHPMTMARMNRLFGVTMAEKGVSQLVSVDLATAEGFREAS